MPLDGYKAKHQDERIDKWAAEVARLNAELAELKGRFKPINIVFNKHIDGTLVFVEVETDDGKSIRVGDWFTREGDAYRSTYNVLRIDTLPPASEEVCGGQESRSTS